jgi:hypothetical protein
MTALIELRQDWCGATGNSRSTSGEIQSGRAMPLIGRKQRALLGWWICIISSVFIRVHPWTFFLSESSPSVNYARKDL